MAVRGDDGQDRDVSARAQLAPEPEPGALRAQGGRRGGRGGRVRRHGGGFGRGAHLEPEIARVDRDRIEQRARIDAGRVGRSEPQDRLRVRGRGRRRRGRLQRQQRVQRKGDGKRDQRASERNTGIVNVFNRARGSRHHRDMHPNIRIFLATIWFVVAALVSCGGGVAGPNSPLVGAACTADTQCEQQCLDNERHFPGGMCTIPCSTDGHCPSGWVCIDEEGGVCVVTCSVDADCAGFGRGFTCDSEARPNGVEASICRVP